MNSIHLDFVQAKAKHLQFKSRLRSILYGLTIDEEPVLSHFECGVGKWIYGHALIQYKNIPEMAELEKIHASIHITARELVSLYKRGQIEEARLGLTKIEVIADHLVSLLDTIERKIEDAFVSPGAQHDNLLVENLKVLEELQKANYELEARIKEQSHELLINKERFRIISLATKDVIWDWDVMSNTLWLNENFKISFGYTQEQIEPGIETWYNKIHPEDKERILKSIREIIDNEALQWKGEYRFCCANGQYAHILDRGYVLKNELGKSYRMLGCMQDITDLILARNDIEKGYQRFSLLSEAMPQIVWTATPDGNLDYFSQQWWIYSGLNFEQSVGQGWASTIHEEDIHRLSTLWAHSLQTGEPYQVEAKVRRVDGVYRWFLIRALCIKENGNIVQWIGTCTDIQEQKRSEKELRDLTSELAIVNEEFQASNEELSEANHHLNLINSDLDNFIYTASHDLKAPISNIEGLMLALKQSLPQEIRQEEEIETYTALIDASVERFKKTINQLTDITQLQKEFNLEASEVSLEEIIKDVLLDLQMSISKTNTNLEIDSSIHTTIHFSHKNLRSIVYNLLSNAIKYSSPERLPHIKISCDEIPDYKILSFSDNGLGMDLTNRSKLFAMFGRLHDHVEGSGVGLYIVKKMLDNVGGKIEVESQVGIGSTFRVFFKNKNLKSKRL